MKARLKSFVEGLSDRLGRPVKSRIFVDDGPMNDRAAAERAGVGWFGKNTNILTSTHGSWVLLGQVITDLELEPDAPLAKNCGECVRCIDACPTGAIVAPYVIDNRRCISFLTIELRGIMPRELRPLVGDWVFGCDICQDICPVNRDVALSLEPAFQQRHDFGAPALLPLLELDDEGFRERFRNSPVKRAKRVGLQRNVCVALGNIGDPAAVPALSEGADGRRRADTSPRGMGTRSHRRRRGPRCAGVSPHHRTRPVRPRRGLYVSCRSRGRPGTRCTFENDRSP